MANVKGNVSVSTNNANMQFVTNGTTGVAFGGTAGAYLDSMIVMALTTGSAAVYLGDGGGGTVQVFGTTAIVDTRQIRLGVTSKVGPWRVTTGAGVTATLIGRT